MSAGRRIGMGVVTLLVAVHAPARAADIVVRTPDPCVDASAIEEQAADLLGQPLASVAGVTFEVELARATKPAWRLRLDTIEAPSGAGARGEASGERRSRVFTADSCADLAEAAAVGIAMSVRSIEAARERAAPRPSTGSAVPAAVTVAPRPPPAPVPTTFAGSLAAVGDTGALPQAGVGVELGASLRRPRFRLRLAGAIFASQVARPTGGSGGEFQLVFGSLTACLPTGLAGATFFGCAGGELGRLSAVGVGLSVPRLGTSLWLAGRIEIGVSLPISTRLAIVLRGGLTVPVNRPLFTFDTSMPVHRADQVAVRATAGIEIEY